MKSIILNLKSNKKALPAIRKSIKSQRIIILQAIKNVEIKCIRNKNKKIRASRRTKN